MPEDLDPYSKLRPRPPTPKEELCSCVGELTIVLAGGLRSNPLKCLACNREIPPERLSLSESLAERVAFWASFFDCFFRLWLDSQEYESWARSQLEDPTSPVNPRALDVVPALQGPIDGSVRLRFL